MVTFHVQSGPEEPLSASAATAPAEVRQRVPTARLAGAGKLTFLGFEVYNASLWVGPGFEPDAYERHAFALELGYLRSFSGADIARRSLDEMKRLQPIAEQQALQWETAMRELLPSVRKGDRIAGVNQPGEGATFLINGKPGGVIADAEFARLFFGIWLLPKTSEPRLREALLAQVKS